jgi:hypothetical protein
VEIVSNCQGCNSSCENECVAKWGGLDQEGSFSACTHECRKKNTTQTQVKDSKEVVQLSMTSQEWQTLESPSFSKQFDCPARAAMTCINNMFVFLHAHISLSFSTHTNTHTCTHICNTHVCQVLEVHVRVPPEADLTTTMSSAKVLLVLMNENVINTQLVMYMYSSNFTCNVC